MNKVQFKKVCDMYEQVEKSKEETKSRAVANSVTKKKSNVKQGFGFVDNRPEFLHQLVAQKMNNHPFSNKVNSKAVNEAAIIQFVTEKDIVTSLRNVAEYSPDMHRDYGEAIIRAVLRENDLRVRGHASGSRGDTQNAATTQDLRVLRDALRRYQSPVATATSVEYPRAGGLQHNQKERDEAAAKKNKIAEAKKAKKKEKYQQSLRDNHGKRPPKGGGGSSSATQRKSNISIRQEKNGIVQRTVFDDEISTVVWTPDFDQKHFAESPEEATTKGMARIKQSAFKDSGAKPDSNTVIIYNKELLFWLKETILNSNIIGRFQFQAQLAYDISGQGITTIVGATFNVNVNDRNQIDHLYSVEGGTREFHTKKSSVTKFDNDSD